MSLVPPSSNNYAVEKTPTRSPVDPRRADGRAIDYTPHNKELQKTYQYYCPICCWYFKKMYQSKCCNNYLCEYCYRDLFEGHMLLSKMSVQNIHNLEDDQPKPKKPPCPYCQQEIHVEKVDKTAAVRTYIDGQAVHQHQASPGVPEVTTPKGNIQDLRRRLFRMDDDPTQLEVQLQQWQSPGAIVLEQLTDSPIPRRVWSAPTEAKRSRNIVHEYQLADHHAQYGNNHSFVAYRNVIVPATKDQLVAISSVNNKSSLASKEQHIDKLKKLGQILDSMHPQARSASQNTRPGSAPSSLFSMLGNIGRKVTGQKRSAIHAAESILEDCKTPEPPCRTVIISRRSSQQDSDNSSEASLESLELDYSTPTRPANVARLAAPTTQLHEHGTPGRPERHQPQHDDRPVLTSRSSASRQQQPLRTSVPPLSSRSSTKAHEGRTGRFITPPQSGRRRDARPVSKTGPVEKLRTALLSCFGAHDHG